MPDKEADVEFTQHLQYILYDINFSFELQRFESPKPGITAPGEQHGESR